MKKACKILTIAIIIFFAICANNFVRAAQGDYGKVSNLSDAEVTLSGEGTGNVKLKYSRLNLTWYKADLSIGRTVDGYWVGYKVEFPENLGGSSAEETEVKKAKYRSRFIGKDWSETKSFYDAKDGEWFMTGWVQITQSRLDANDGDFDLFEVEFDWQGDGQFEQNVTIEINAENVTLDPSNVTTVTVKETGNGASDEVRNFLISTGKSLNEGLVQSELDTLAAIKNKEGFVKFYEEGKEDEEFSFDEPIEETEITIIALFNKPIVEPEPEPELTPEPPAKAKDETPKTGDTNLINYVMIETSALVILAIAINVLRKKNSK